MVEWGSLKTLPKKHDSLREKVWPLLEAGDVAPVIYETFPLEAAAEAHRLMESSVHVGKIMLEVGD